MSVKRLSSLALLVWAASSGVSSAELVYLTSGRHLSVRGHRDEGETIVLLLRNGGEVACARALISRIEPDEVPYPEPAGAPSDPSSQQALASVPYGEIIDQIAAKHGVNAGLVRAMIQVESGYKPRARSRKGAMGLMQLMPWTARQYSVKNPFDPLANIEGGIKHLKSLLQRFELSLALAAYNAGEAAVRRFGGIPPYRETRNYVNRILTLARLTGHTSSE